MLAHVIFKRYFCLIICLVLIGNDSFKQNIPSIFEKQREIFSRTTVNRNLVVSEYKGTKSTFSLHARKRFILGEKEIIISCVVSKFSNPSSTRLVPPITWLTSSGSRVKVLRSIIKSGSLTSTFNSDDSDSVGYDSSRALSTIDKVQNINSKSSVVQSSVLEISVPRKRVDETLMNLRGNGFKKQDIYRMLDKGPWTLAFDVPGPLSKLMADLENDLGLNQSQSVHVISHCPYLLAQYACYRGRDVFATARALLEVGYSAAHLTEDIMRFPSMLAAPPGRINGWLSLLQVK